MTAMLEENENFATLLKNIRTEEEVSLDQLAYGIMSTSQLARIEKGERSVAKVVRDRLLERLGVARDLYENLLDLEDYREWERQKDILHAVREKQTEQAEQLLSEYEESLEDDENIRRQFYLVMLADIQKKTEGQELFVRKCYREALALTVPEADTVWAKQRPLSILEINLLLENLAYENGMDSFLKYKVLLRYVEDGCYDEISKAKIYPKIAFYSLKKRMQYREHLDAGERMECLEICGKAVERLRDAGRTYYLVELLEIRKQLLEDQLGELNGEEQEENLAVQREDEELLKVIRDLYRQYDVTDYMEDCTYLYQQKWVFPIGEVLKIRRTMFGMTQEQLCDGICSVKSLRRAEQGKTDIQREVREKLLNRLGLSGQLQWTRLITSDRAVVKLAEQLAKYLNVRDFIMARMVLEELKNRTLTEIPQNRQFILEMEALLDYNEHKIGNEQFVKLDTEALRYTLGSEDVIRNKNVYLTEMEIKCIRNRWKGLEKNRKIEEIKFLLDIYHKYSLKNEIANAISMYEFVTEGAVSELGNLGENELAIQIDRQSIKESLKCRRLVHMDYKLYDILWNKQEMANEKEDKADLKKMADELKSCISISHYTKRFFYEKIYRDKLVNVHCQD